MVGELTKAMEKVGLDMRVAALVRPVSFLLLEFMSTFLLPEVMSKSSC